MITCRRINPMGLIISFFSLINLNNKETHTPLFSHGTFKKDIMFKSKSNDNNIFYSKNKKEEIDVICDLLINLSLRYKYEA